MHLGLLTTVTLVLCLICPSSHQNVGQLRQYEFETTVLLNDKPHNRKQTVGFKISADFEISTVWVNPSNKNELISLLKITKLQVADGKGKSKSSVKKQYVDRPVVVHVTNDDVIIHSPVGETADNNFIRGIVQLIHVNKKNGVFTEKTVSGSCNVNYETKEGAVTKIISGCVNDADGSFEHFNKVLATKLNRDTKIQYKFNENNVIQSVEAHESYSETSSVYSSAVTALTSKSTVTLKSQSQAQSRYDGKTAQDVINSIAKEFSVQFKDLNPLADVGTIECVGNCQSAKDSIARLKKHLRVDQLASTSSAKAFIIALNAFRSASTKEILTVLKGNKKILPQLMDILGVTQTKASLDAAFQFIKFDVEDGDTDGIEIVERFLLSLGISSHPDSYALKKLVDIARKKIPSTKIEQTIILTVGALMKSVNIISTKNEVVLSSLKFIVDKLEKCKDDACRHLSLKALKNFGDPIILPVIEKFMQYGGKVTVTALKALSTLKKQFISMKIKAMLKDICFEVNKKQDSSSRILAADILLQSDPSECFVKRLIRSLSDQKSEELSTYVLKRIQELTEQLPELGTMVQRVMKEMSVGNYNTLAQKGLSVAMTNPLFSSKDVSTNYGMHTELLKGGMLKTTSFDVDVFSGSDNFILISVGAFAAGLESFVGESSAGEDEEQEDATCGMQITLLGVTLRPYKFFTGQGELMSLVWSGAGSEPTPALQGNFILNDVANQIVLHNGITVQNTLQGVISTDLSGSVQISLWNRNAESVVNNKGAFLLRGTISVQTDLVNTFVQYDVDANAALNFITSLDFYNSPSRMCMEMDQPPFVIRHNVTKIEGISSVKHNKKKTYQKVTNVLGRSYALPQAIYKACRSLKAS